MDTVKELGELALASRLKRISERLSKEVTLVYKKLNVDFEARWFTLITRLQKKSPAKITELATNLGLSHTAIQSLASELIKKGYIGSIKDEKDERQRLLFITETGQELCKKLDPVWKEIKEANVQLINSVDINFLSKLNLIEDELNKFSMYERVWHRLTGHLPGEVKIQEYTPSLKKHFQRLNYEWLEEYFEIEEKDKFFLSDPKNKIINRGGYVFFAILENSVVGTCALLKHSEDRMELAKMAVTKKYRGRGIGRKLLEAAIEKVQSLGMQNLYLQTNKSLKEANILYSNFGFKKIKINPLDSSVYQRETYTMKLDILNNFSGEKNEIY